MNRIKSFIIIFFSILPITIYAQINLRPGYIITNSNDTIYGSIDFRTAERNAHQCTFKETASEETTYYAPGEIYAYRFTDDGKFYVTRSVKVNDVEQKYFLEYIIQGIISMYYLPGETTRFYFETEEGKMVEVAKEDKYMTNDDGKSGIKQDTRYIGILSYLFSENKESVKKIPRLSFGKENLAKLTKEYHYAVCETGKECIEFEAKKDNNYVKFSYTILAGMKIHTIDVVCLRYWKMKSASPSLGIDVRTEIPRLSRVFGAHIALDVSAFRGERAITAKNNGYLQFKSESFVVDNRIGIRYTPIRGKLGLYVEAGYAQSFLMDIKQKSIQEVYTHEGEIKIAEKDYSNYLPSSLFVGYYAGIGLDYPLKKHVISLNGYYSHRTKNTNDINTINISAGFTF
ncbi:hypothetical protein LJC29_07225 [Bacteroides sp. OttesenSCG-928-N06]|nr:hypothetical protein [Bacteroides sp. OttesenSCG-928-N06]